MTARMMWRTQLACILCICLQLALSQTQQADDCKWTYNEVFSYDLGPLAKALGKVDFKFSESDGFGDDGKLNTNICRNCAVPKRCADEGHNIPAVGYAKFKQPDNSWDCYRLGSLEKVKWTVLDPSNPMLGVKMEYGLDEEGDASDRKRLIYKIECDPLSDIDHEINEAGKGRLFEGYCDLPFVEDYCQVRWTSKAGCPACEGGCEQYVPVSWGTQFVAWFLFSFIVYASVGFTYNMRQKGLKGIEAFPNIEFWRKVLRHSADGLVWTKNRVMLVMASKRAHGQTYQVLGTDENPDGIDSPNSIGEDDTFLEGTLEDQDPE